MQEHVQQNRKLPDLTGCHSIVGSKANITLDRALARGGDGEVPRLKARS